jgi:hypothetical protein
MDIIMNNQFYFGCTPASRALTTTFLRRRSMKLVKNFLFAVIVVSAISVNTPAGELDTPGYVPPPPPRQMSTSDGTTTVLTSATDSTGDVTVETSDYLIYEALAALLSVY